VSLALCVPINIIIEALSGTSVVTAHLPAVACVVLVLISMLLTFIAGLFPSRIAAKKDPVVALRTE
jgi:putative ABC transport system permease protein